MNSAPSPSFSSGTLLGGYEIVAPLGAGGMGEVYRARDPKLDREVAIKVLPEGFASDQERLARFEREAKSLAALNHPNIATVHGFFSATPVPGDASGQSLEGPIEVAAPGLEQEGDTHFLVMELVEGQDLSERIARGPLSVDEAIPLFIQIAEGLEVAHEKGIIHRDLKPANVMVSEDGRVKILDFGLAKAMEAQTAASDPDLSQSPTMTAAATMRGEIMGTAAYMSPEQASGKPVDKRSDIWAFGVCLYEALTGERAFQGEDAPNTLAAVLRDEIDQARLPDDCPAALVTLLDRCLARSPRERLRDIGDARFELRAALEPGGEGPEAVSPAARWSTARLLVSCMAALLVGVLATAAIGRFFATPDDDGREATWTAIGAPPHGFAYHAAPVISPDGRTVAFWALDGEGSSGLWTRPLDSAVATLLPGTRSSPFDSWLDGIPPFWSPDGRSLGFFAEAELKRVDLEGGDPLALADAPNPRGGTWAPDGTIIFMPDSGGDLHRVSASGGEPSSLSLSQPFRQASWPHVLPDGEHFLVTTSGELGGGEVWVASLDGQEVETLMSVESRVEYANGRVFYGSKGALFARTFDERSLALSGDPQRIADGLGFSNGDQWSYSFSVSAAGALVYWGGTNLRRTQLTWLDRRGEIQGRVGDPGEYFGFSPAPDGRELVVERHAPQVADLVHLWLVDISTGMMSPLLSGLQNDERPWVEATLVWAPSGEQVLFGTFPGVVAYSLGDGSLETIHDAFAWVLDVSPDGKFALVWMSEPETAGDLWTVELSGERRLRPYLRSPEHEDGGRFAPSGRWVAYSSDETGQREVYVQSFPEPGRPKRISAQGGDWVSWRPDGRELYYVGLDGTLMAVGVDGRGSRFASSSPEPLFRIGARLDIGRQQHWSPDGERFLVNLPVEDATPVTFTVVQNWPALLREP